MKILTTILLLLSFSAHATPIDDAKTVLNTLAGVTLDNAKLLRIADRFVAAYPGQLPDGVTDPTNTQKAQLVLDVLHNFTRGVVTRDADKNTEADNAATKTANRATALADLE